MDNLLNSLLVAIGGITVLASICYTIYNVFRPFKLKKLENAVEGFGIIYKQQILLDNNAPLIFTTLADAKDHVIKRKLGKPNSFNKGADVSDVKYVYQRWDVEKTELTIHPLIFKES